MEEVGAVPRGRLVIRFLRPERGPHGMATAVAMKLVAPSAELRFSLSGTMAAAFGLTVWESPGRSMPASSTMVMAFDSAVS